MSWYIWFIITASAPWLICYIVWKIIFKNSFKVKSPILTYHQVSDRFNLSITRQRLHQFERGIRFLYELGYRTVGLEEVGNFCGDGGQRKIALTFDDAYEDVYLNAFPVLQKFGFVACIFVITGYVGKYNSWDYNWGRNKKKHLSWEQIKEMADAGFHFGSHTINHPDLTKIPHSLVEHELKRSKEILEDNLGRSVDFLSYPFGRYNRYVQKEAERLGYKGAYTLAPNPGTKAPDQFAQKRWGVYLLDSPLSLTIKLNSGRLLWMEGMKGWIINQFPCWVIALRGLPDYPEVETKSQFAEVIFRG